MQRVICYVDGFNLYHGLRSKSWRKYYWLDLWKLTERFLLQNQTLKKLVYFTARLKKNPPSRNRQRLYIDALTAFRPDTKVLYGHYLAKEMRCKKCGYKYLRHEEKMTDVNIACQLLLDAVDDKFDTAIIVSGDSDLVPPIKEIKSRFPNKRVIVLFPPNRVSVDLREISHGHRKLLVSDVRRSQLPVAVQIQSGDVVCRPITWS